MTGYGKTQAQINNKIIDFEIRSLNSKNLDINIKTSYYFKSLESEFRKLICSKIKRGRIDLNINYTNADPASLKINTNVLNKEIWVFENLRKLILYNTFFNLSSFF